MHEVTICGFTYQGLDAAACRRNLEHLMTLPNPEAQGERIADWKKEAERLEREEYESVSG